jgi:hypothetical protein
VSDAILIQFTAYKRSLVSANLITSIQHSLTSQIIFCKSSDSLNISAISTQLCVSQSSFFWAPLPLRMPRRWTLEMPHHRCRDHKISHSQRLRFKASEMVPTNGLRSRSPNQSFQQILKLSEPDPRNLMTKLRRRFCRHAKPRHL